jgi:hypothetical protein
MRYLIAALGAVLLSPAAIVAGLLLLPPAWGLPLIIVAVLYAVAVIGWIEDCERNHASTTTEPFT